MSAPSTPGEAFAYFPSKIYLSGGDFIILSQSEKRKINRARKKLKESKYTHFDRDFKNALATFRCLDLESIKKITSKNDRCLSDNRLDLYLKANYIQKDKIVIKNKIVEVYFPTNYGERDIKNIRTDCKDKIYKSASLEHDYSQSKYVIGKYNVQDIKDYYKSEYELEKASRGESRTDGAFIFNDERQNIYIETITQHYTKPMKQAKENYANARGGVYDGFRVTI